MKTSKNIEHYKAKIIELADKLLEKEKECSYLSALKSVHEMRIEALEKQLNDDKRYKDLIEHIEQQDLKITSLIKQRDNYKNDYEYVEECFQAERNRRWELEEQLNKIKDIVKDEDEFYPECPLKVHYPVKYNLDNYEIACFELHDTDNKQVFFVKDKIKHQSIIISDLVNNGSLSEYTLVPALMETFDILQVQRFDGKSVTNKYIDLLTNKVYNDNWYTIVEERGKK